MKRKAIELVDSDSEEDVTITQSIRPPSAKRPASSKLQAHNSIASKGNKGRACNQASSVVVKREQEEAFYDAVDPNGQPSSNQQRPDSSKAPSPKVEESDATSPRTLKVEIPDCSSPRSPKQVKSEVSISSPTTTRTSPTARTSPTTSSKQQQPMDPASPQSINRHHSVFNVQDTAKVFTMGIKDDHRERPLWVFGHGSPLQIVVYLETWCSLSTEAADFLVVVAEPLSRPSLVHEYRITQSSLYTAVSIGMTSSSILGTLGKLSKIAISSEVSEMVKKAAASFGKATLVLRNGRYFIQSKLRDVLERLNRVPGIQEAMIGAFEVTEQQEQAEMMDVDADGDGDDGKGLAFLGQHCPTRAVTVYLVEVEPKKVQQVKQLASQASLPLLCEYEFRQDTTIEDIELELKDCSRIRPYQRKGLTKMFGNGRARSGTIVLPCGAGKTFVGITACCTVKKPALVLTSGGLAAEQWKQQFKDWCTVGDHQIFRFTANTKDRYTENTDIVIATYNMIAHSGTRSKQSQAIMNKISSRVWGIIVLDEVHVVPSEMFRKVLSLTRFHTALGLTATLLREDDKISDLTFLIGPKLYEANWWELVAAGNLARVECAEVHCPMTKEFYRHYLTGALPFRRRLLYVMNPNKIQACQFLINWHESRGDRTLVFSDDVFALIAYAKALDRPFIYGATSMKDRLRILGEFRHGTTCTVFISKIGDQAINLPEATVIIQVSSHFGSRRQETQRLGRILRAKDKHRAQEYVNLSEELARKKARGPNMDDTFLAKSESLFKKPTSMLQQHSLDKDPEQNPNAFFYSLVSSDTQEMYFSTKRQKFLIDQGYTFKVFQNLPPDSETQDLVYSTKDSRLELLTKVLAVTTDTLEDGAEGKESDDRMEESDEEESMPRGRPPPAPWMATVRKQGAMSGLSGAGDLVYTEYTAADGKQQSTVGSLGNNRVKEEPNNATSPKRNEAAVPKAAKATSSPKDNGPPMTKAQRAHAHKIPDDAVILTLDDLKAEIFDCDAM